MTNAQFVSLFALLKNSKKPEQMTLAKLSIKVVIASLFLIIQTSIYNTTQAQIPAIEWQNTIGGSGYDQIESIIQTTDGGYLLGGYSDSNSSGDKTENSQGGRDYWVAKLNASGSITWQNTIGGSGQDYLYSVIQTLDGGYLLGGHSTSSISVDKTENSQGSWDYWVVKLDAAGSIIWENTIGGNNGEQLNSIIQTTDGGYLLGGYSASSISGDKTENSQGGADYWVVKLDTSGSIIWQNTIGGSSDDIITSIIQTTDGGYLLGGYSASSISGDKTENSLGSKAYWVVKIDAAGTITWQNTIAGNGFDELNSIIQTQDGGYLLGGHSGSNISGDKTENSQGGDDYWVVKLDAVGSITWQNTIGGNNTDYLTSIIQTTDGSYLLGGYSASNSSGDKTENSQGSYDYWVVKLDASGSITWQNTIGGGSYEELNSIIQTTDGGYLLGGVSVSPISGDKTENTQGGVDYWVVKLASEPSAGCTDSSACNYDATASVDDGSCEVLSCAGCTDSNACNYDITATIEDGSCEAISCAGCTDSNACNYDITATIEDSSCLVIGMSCDDGDLCTSNDTIDANCNCVGTPNNCDDGNPCTDDICDPINGGCIHTPVAAGTLCEDGDLATTSVCIAGSCTLVVVDMDVDGYDSTVDCDDNNPDVYPNAAELCDGLDNDCDGEVDEGLDDDSDGDSLTDCDELFIYLTDPLDADSDNDGLTDGLEVNHSGTDPLLTDTDGDGCSDDLEFSLACPDSECMPPVNPCIGDFTGDGSVNVNDLGGFLGAFGTTCE